jgi:hypothetical protein
MWRPIGRAIEIRQGIGGGRTYEGQGEESQGNNDRRRSARGPVKCRRIQCLSHLRPLRYKASRKFPHRTNKRAVAWTIQRRLLRDCPTKAVSNHGLIWLIIGYRRGSRCRRRIWLVGFMHYDSGVSREELLMKLGAARSRAPAAWRLHTDRSFDKPANA